MLLCDIGNTSYHFLEDEKDYKEYVETFDPSTIKEEVFYICVNPKIKEILKSLKNWIDLSTYVDMTQYYSTMGVDRIFACEAVTNSVVVDTGSAITVDVVKEGLFQGGFIYPGIKAMSQTYKNISTALEYPFNFELDLTSLPKNSVDAISYGYLKTLYNEVVSYEIEIILTGGDAENFLTLFPNAKIDKKLIFKGMKQVMLHSK